MTDIDSDFTADLNDAEWNRLLAVVMILQKRCKTLEYQAKAHLLDRLEPGSPEAVTLGDVEVAQISATKGGTKAKPRIKDVDAYVEWLLSHGHEADTDTVFVPKKHAFEESYIEDVAKENGGALPDGVEMGRPSSPTVRVSLTRGIVDKPLDLSLVPAIGQLLQLTAPQPMASQESEEEEDPWAAK